MKSLLERVLARPYHAVAWVIAALAIIAALWWLFCPQASTENTATTTVTNAPIAQLSVQSSDTASAITATSETAATETVTVAANTALPTDPALAEEELDRLNDEHQRLKERKAQLAQQLEISNKLVAMKEQQLKTLDTPNQ